MIMSMKGRVMTDDRGINVRTSHAVQLHILFPHTCTYIHMVTRERILLYKNVNINMTVYKFNMLIVHLVTYNKYQKCNTCTHSPCPILFNQSAPECSVVQSEKSRPLLKGGLEEEEDDTE